MANTTMATPKLSAITELVKQAIEIEETSVQDLDIKIRQKTEKLFEQKGEHEERLKHLKEELKVLEQLV